MSPLIIQYLDALVEIFECRQGQLDEGGLIGKMDAIWYNMSREERDDANMIAQYMAKVSDGII